MSWCGVLTVKVLNHVATHSYVWSTSRRSDVEGDLEGATHGPSALCVLGPRTETSCTESTMGPNTQSRRGACPRIELACHLSTAEAVQLPLSRPLPHLKCTVGAKLASVQYQSLREIDNSDHKPVFAEFTVADALTV